MNYLSNYDDMCLITFTIYDEIIEPLLKLLCNHMGFEIIMKEAKQKNPVKTPFQFENYNGYYNTNGTFYYCTNKDDDRSFLLISEGVSNWFGVSIKIKTNQLNALYSSIYDILQYIEDYAGPPCPTSAKDLICHDLSYIEKDLKNCGLI